MFDVDGSHVGFDANSFVTWTLVVYPTFADNVPAIAVEAGSAQSFRALVGRRGMIWGMKGFGASAPGGNLAEHFGFTPDQLSERIREFLAK